MDAKGGHYDVQIKRQMDKGGHYDVQKEMGWSVNMVKLKGRIKGIMMWKLKGGCKRGHYDVQIKRVDGIREGHYDVEMKGWMQKGGHYDVQIKRVDG